MQMKEVIRSKKSAVIRKSRLRSFREIKLTVGF